MNVSRGIALALVLALVGCGKDSGNNKLSAADKDKVSDTLNGLGRAERVGLAAHKLVAGTRPASADTTDQDVQLVRAIMYGPCRIEAKGLPTRAAASNSNIDYALTVSGTNCPMSVQYSLKLDSGLFGFDLTQGATVKVNDESLKPYSDIDSLSWKGAMNGKWDIQHSRSSDGKIVITGSINGNGDAHSQKYGAITLALTGSLSGEKTDTSSKSHAEQALTVKYPDLTAVFKTVADNDGTQVSQKYYLNDEEISAQQYSDYLNRAGTLFVAAFPALK